MCNLAQVFLATKHGVEAKNYENLGDAAKLKPLEVELKRLEDMSESIVQDFAFMRRREVRQTHTFIEVLLASVSIFLISGGDERYERVDQQSCSLLLHILYVLPVGSGHLAGEALLREAFNKKNHFLIDILERASSIKKKP